MLIVYTQTLEVDQLDLLESWGSLVHYWPRSYARCFGLDIATPLDWWLLFAQGWPAYYWLSAYPEASRIIRRLD